MTALIITVTYKQQEFFRIGYYVYNNYTEPELLENPPDQVILEKITRNILIDKPRITKFNIKWSDKEEEAEMKDVQESTEDESTRTGMQEEKDVPDNFLFMGGDLQDGGFFGNNNPFLASANKSEEYSFI